MTKIVLTLLAVLVLLAGCIGTDPGGGLDGEWRLTSGTHDGADLPMPPHAPITMSVADGEISGRAACNLYSGTVELDGERILIGAMSVTEMGCDPPVMEAETAYLAALAEVTTWERAADRATLRGDGVELVFALVPPPKDAALVGTRWMLDGLVVGDAVSSTIAGAAPGILELREDGTLTGSTGCRTFDGRYALDGSTLAISDLVTDDRACPDLAAQDEHVLAVLDGEVTVAIDGPQLTLTSGELGLIYRAEP